MENKKLILITLCLLVCLLACGCRRDVLRLHVIANSDSASDQRIKLEVRDAVLAFSAQCETDSKSEIRSFFAERLDELTEVANGVLKAEGVAYTASLSLGVSHFPDKTYDGVTYPEGDYDALRVVLGEGSGQNWWCVIFPPLCLPQGASTEDVEYTSAVAEFFSGLFGGREARPLK